MIQSLISQKKNIQKELENAGDYLLDQEEKTMLAN